MKKTIYLMILLLAVVSGLVFANRAIKEETKPTTKPLTTAEQKARNEEARKQWEATPEGIHYKVWKQSDAGKKVYASHDKIRKNINSFSDMQAVVSSVTFQRGNAKSAVPKWLIVKINDDEYMMQYSLKDFENLKSLKVNDKIIIRSRSAGYSPNHPYLILSGDYIARDKEVLFKRDLSKNNGC